jgi:branched-chain amino acid transport system permease protein
MTGKMLGILFVAMLAALPWWMADPYVLATLTSKGIFVIAAISLNLLLGYTGQLSLGHAAFFGIGAYASALLALGFDVDLGLGTLVVGAKPVWLAFAGAIVVSGFFGLIIGKLAFRVRGAYFVIVTIGFAQVMRMVALNWVDLTQGPMALNNIPPLSVWWPGRGTVALTSKAATYWLMLTVAVVSYLLVARLAQSRIGRALVALRENEPLARSVGVAVTHYLVVATVVSAAIAGAAGSIYAHYVRIVDPDVFLFIYTVTMVIMVVTGGKGTLAGPVVGGIIFGLLPEILRGSAAPEVQWIIYGIGIVLIVFFLPRGIVPALQHFLQVWTSALRERMIPVTQPRLPEPTRPVADATPPRDPLAIAAPPATLAVRGLTVRIGGLVAVDDVSFDVTSGQIVSLIGPNGAGKTTAFNVITGYLRPTAGAVQFGEHDLTRLAPEQIAALGVVRTFQRTSLFADCTVFDNVLTALHLHGRTGVLGAVLRLPAMRREEARLHAAADDILDLVSLGTRAGEPAGNLSYGEQRLLGLAIALGAAPRLLLLDESVAGLNPVETESFKHLVGRVRDRGTTVLLVEHDMRMVMSISDTVLVLNQGRLIASGPPESVQREPEVVRAYLGTGRKRAAA